MVDNKTERTHEDQDAAVDRDNNDNNCWNEGCQSPNDDFCSVWICVVFYSLVYYGQKNVEKPTVKNHTSNESKEDIVHKIIDEIILDILLRDQVT